MSDVVGLKGRRLRQKVSHANVCVHLQELILCHRAYPILCLSEIGLMVCRTLLWRTFLALENYRLLWHFCMFLPTSVKIFDKHITTKWGTHWHSIIKWARERVHELVNVYTFYLSFPLRPNSFERDTQWLIVRNSHRVGFFQRTLTLSSEIKPDLTRLQSLALSHEPVKALHKRETENPFRRGRRYIMQVNLTPRRSTLHLVRFTCIM